MHSRSLSESEYSLTKWMIEHGNCDSSLFLSQLDKAKVIRKRGCGCASVDFQIGNNPSDSTAGLEILSDYLYGEQHPELYSAFVFAKDGILAGLEVYSLTGQTTPAELPSPEQLYPFDQPRRNTA